MAKQQGCFAAQQSCAAKSFFAFRHHIIIIVTDGEGRVLLQRRSDNGCWGYAGGAVEMDERVEDAARRELLEETGLTALELELFGIFSGPECHFYYPNGDEVSYVDIVFTCRRWSGTPRPQAGEVEELRFFPRDALPENITPVSRKALFAWLAAQEADRS